MAERSLEGYIRGVLSRLKVQEVERLTDAELLARYVASRDEAAFTALVGRHGPTVLSVCRRVLHGSDVDDAFQATFLALAKQAGSIRRPDAVGPWLYEVAYHTALKARTRLARSQQLELNAAVPAEAASPADEVVYQDLQKVIDEELHQMPERVRRAMVLVHLMGHVQVDAARELGITDRALRKRLQVGRERLRQGLTRRGVTLSAAALSAALGRQVAASPLPPGLVRPTVQSVLAYAAGQAGAVSGGTVALAMAGVGGSLAARFKLVGLLAAGPVLAALVLTAYALSPAPLAPAGSGDSPVPELPRAEAENGPIDILTGQVLGADGQPVPHAAVTALVRRPWRPSDRGLQDVVVARDTADAAGRYRLVVPADFPTWYGTRRVTLLAHSPGQAPATGTVALHGHSSSTDLRLAGGAAVSGRLLGPDGKPAAGVRLAVVRLGQVVREITQGAESSPAPPGWPTDVVSDATGQFRLAGLPASDSVWLQVQDDRFALTTFTVPAGAAEPVAITLAWPRVLTGRVVANGSDSPLAGARLSVLVGSMLEISDHYTRLAKSPDSPLACPPFELSGQADALGRFGLRLPPGDSYLFFAYPPEGADFLRRVRTLVWAEGERDRELTVGLPRGVRVRGEVADDDGRPVAGASVYYFGPAGTAEDASSPTDQVQFRDTATMTKTDGRFEIVVPSGPSRLEVFGPAADFLRHDDSFLLCPTCGVYHVRSYAHARAALALPPGACPDALHFTLRRGTTITGRVRGPDGEPIGDGVAVCRCIVHPLRRKVPLALPIRDGTFEVPGCAADRTYPVLFLDSERQWAAVAEVRAPTAGEPTPSVQLAPCGRAEVRLTDAAGRPLAGRRPLVRFYLGHDRPAGEPAESDGRRRPLPVLPSWIDGRHDLTGPTTDAQGRVVLATLVPGLEYEVIFSDGGRREYRSQLFRVEPGRVVTLPDIVAVEDEGG